LKAVDPSKGVSIPKEVISTVYPVKVYLAKEARHTWGGDWSYWRDAAWHVSLNEAMTYCEKHRVQGSHWKIMELPAVIFQGCKFGMICSQLADSPLTGIGKVSANSFEDLHAGVAQLFKPIDVKWFMVENKFPTPMQMPFRIHESVAQGGQLLLRWSSSDRRQKAMGSIQMVTRQMAYLLGETVP